MRVLTLFVVDMLNFVNWIQTKTKQNETSSISKYSHVYKSSFQTLYGYFVSKGGKRV